jgi:hypothetical protein
LGAGSISVDRDRVAAKNGPGSIGLGPDGPKSHAGIWSDVNLGSTAVFFDVGESESRIDDAKVDLLVVLKSFSP